MAFSLHNIAMQCCTHCALLTLFHFSVELETNQKWLKWIIIFPFLLLSNKPWLQDVSWELAIVVQNKHRCFPVFLNPLPVKLRPWVTQLKYTVCMFSPLLCENNCRNRFTLCLALWENTCPLVDLNISGIVILIFSSIFSLTHYFRLNPT